MTDLQIYLTVGLVVATGFIVVNGGPSSGWRFDRMKRREVLAKHVEWLALNGMVWLGWPFALLLLVAFWIEGR